MSDDEIVVEQTDVENLNLDKLTNNMLKGIYVLESALFSQAGYEFNRISRMRGIISQLEEDIFSEETLQSLPPLLKLKLYSTLNRNMNYGLSFLQELHNSISSGLDAVKNMEKLKTRPVEVISPEDNVKIDHVKSLIEQAIKKKIEEKEKN